MLTRAVASLRDRVSPQRLRRLTRPAWLGTLRRTTPLSDVWGRDRGTPIDRYYIEQFLEEHQEDIHGRVLEMQDGRYTDRYGVGIERRDVLDVVSTNPLATIVADLTKADSVPSGLFDCFILTRALQQMYEIQSAIAHIHRILCPGGVLLATAPTLCRIDQGSNVGSDYWRFTVDSCRSLFGERFGNQHVMVRPYGNVLSAIAFLTGMASEELSRKERDVQDQYFPVIVAVRAIKSREKEA